MASAKQIAWRKKFARMSKAGVFRKKSKVRKPDGSHQSEDAKERMILHKIKIVEREIKKANRENKQIPQAVHTTLFNIRYYAKKFTRPKLEREVKRLIKLMKNP